MIFLDTNIISYYFNANIKIKKNLKVIDKGENIYVNKAEIFYK